MSNSPKGFTLIELVAVLAVISIMLFFTVPRFNTFSQTDDIKGVSRWLITTVSQLKSKAMSDQIPFVLTVDLSNNLFQISAVGTADESQPDEKASSEEAAISATEFKLSDHIKITGVLYPGQDPISSGQADIFFYAKGYSDRAIIHIADDNNNRLSFLIEPFLNQVELLSGHLDFQQVLGASG